MKPEIRKLLDQINNEDLTLKEEAILSLALLFEKNSLLSSTDELYKSNLKENLIKIKLSELEKDKIVDTIRNLIFSEKFSSSLIWALGKTLTLKSFKVLLEILTSQLAENNKDVLWQALIGIETVLSGDKTYPIYYQAREVIGKKELNSIQKTEMSSDLQLMQIAKRIRKLIHTDKH